MRQLLVCLAAILLLCRVSPSQAQQSLFPMDGSPLYPGLHATLSASVTVGPSGSGFSHGLSIAYADSIMSRLTYTIGGYYRHHHWLGHGYSDAGLTAMLNYRFDQRWEGTLYVQKSLEQPRAPRMPFWVREEMADKIGAEVRYHFSPSFTMGVSVWRMSYPSFPHPLGHSGY